jgi:predicted nucleic acid-binding protein
MKDKRCFLDTNIIVYAHTDLDVKKQQTAQKIIRTSDTFISTQVLGELDNVFSKKFKKAWPQIGQILNEERQNNKVQSIDEQSYEIACEIAEKYVLSFYDSLIVVSALTSGSSILYSEDMQDGLKITYPFDKNEVQKGDFAGVVIKNPFLQ